MFSLLFCQVIEALGEFDTTDQSYNPFEGPVFRKKRSSMCCGWYPFPNQGDTTQAVLDVRTLGFLYIS